MSDDDSLLDAEGGEEASSSASPANEEGRIHHTTQVPKRAYNLSDKAIAARRANAQKSTGPSTPEGKAASSHNAWKHGLHASATALGMVGKPCVSTCHKYPCSLVDGGETQPGRQCLDKEFFLDVLQKIQLAIQEKQLDGVNEIYGHVLAKNLGILSDMQDRLLSEGTVLKNAKMDKFGMLIGWEYVLHPALIALPKLLAALNISFGDAMLTPAAIAKHKAEGDDEKLDAMAVMAAATNTLAAVIAEKKKPPHE